MKTKITSIGVLLCLLAACGIINSEGEETFNPHQLDGVYRFIYHVDVDSLGNPCDGLSCYQNWYTNYISVDYPDMQACAASGQGLPFKPIGKQNVQVARKKEDLYKITKINGHTVDKEYIAYKITTDSSRFDGSTTDYMQFNKIKNGNEYYGTSFKHPSDDDLQEEYQKCISQAPDTTDIFPSTQQYVIKPK